MGLEPPVKSINAFIEIELERLESIKLPAPQPGEMMTKLNEVFQKSIRDAWA